MPPTPRTLSLRDVKPTLDRRQCRFIDELLAHPRFDVHEAAANAGYQRHEVPSLLSSRATRAAVETARRYRAERATVQQDYVLRRWAQLVRADPRELVEHWRVPCRYCWGLEHGYQFNDVELRAAEQAHKLKQLEYDESLRVEFDDLGGGGYTVNRAPCRGQDYADFVNLLRFKQGLSIREIETTADHSCPNCYGWGVSFIVYHDTRELSADAALLYLGVKTTRDGIEILTRNKSEAEQLLARHLGLFNDRKPIEELDPEKLTDDNLERVIASVRERLGDDDAGPPQELLEPAGGGEVGEG